MASLYKRSNGTYYANFFDSNRTPERKRFSLKTSNKRSARRKLAELEDAFVDGQFDPWASGKRSDPYNYNRSEQPEHVTVQETVERFVASKQQERRSERTLDTYRGVWRRFSQRVGSETLIGELQASDVSAYCHDESVSPATQHKRWRHLRSIFTWALEKGFLNSVVTAEVIAPQKENKLPTPVRKEDVPLICGAVAEEYREKRRKGCCRPGQLVWTIPVFRWAFYTGMRATEIGGLRWEHVDRERGLIRIERQKNNKAQTLPLVKQARRTLRHTPLPRPSSGYVFRSPTGPIQDRNPKRFAETVSRRFSKARQRSKIDRDLIFHDLRAGFATALADAGKSAHVIRDAMRHSTLRMALKYVNVSDARLRSELENTF